MRMVLVLAAAGLLGGCGGVQYAVAMNAASVRVGEARTLGAEKLAPYEYYYAKEHLEQAEIEGAEANYSDAVHLAREAEQYASNAIALAEAALRPAP